MTFSTFWRHVLTPEKRKLQQFSFNELIINIHIFAAGGHIGRLTDALKIFCCRIDDNLN